MCFKLALAALLVAIKSVMADLSVDCDSSGTCPGSADMQARALLQAHHRIHRNGAQSAFASNLSVNPVNPSGAAAPLDQAGYAAVANGCCHSEMKEFISRQVLNLNLEVCDEEYGLAGIVPFHSCEKGPQTFDALSSNLLDDSVKTCTWVAPTGQCKPYPGPPTCPAYPPIPPAPECGCSKSTASKLDLFASTVSHSNLGGMGPDSGVAELRYSNAGTTKDGIPFDLVVTASGPYTPRRDQTVFNGKLGKFGSINHNCNPGELVGGPTEFTFSFAEPGTNNPVVQPEVHFGIFDLDGWQTTGEEWISSKGYKGYVTDKVPTILASEAPAGGTKFSASGTADVPNPSDPERMTAKQRANSVMFYFADVSSIQFNFAIEHCTRGTSGGRNFFFDGKSELNDRCDA